MTEGKKKPSDFDWVTEREKCSLKEVFEALRLGIREDVDTRNSTLSDDPDTATLKIAEAAGTIRVYWHDVYSPSLSQKFAEFALKKQNITVTNQDGVLFEAFVGLNDEGDCKVKISGKELDVWQVRRRALEQLMFGPS